MKPVLIALAVVIAVVVLVWVGLQVKPRPFPAHDGDTPSLATIPLPDGLPEPVERFYREVYGDEIPVITSAVISGRATMRPFAGVTLPGRFRFIHEAGQGYRHYIEATLFGLPVMKIDERYLDGVARMELPFGVEEGDPKLAQGANLALWSESIWLPALFLTDDRVRWEPIDEETAVLVVPFEEAEESFVVRFDPETGLVDIFESMRYKGVESEVRTLWINETITWEIIDGHLLPTVGAVTWFDDGSPWAVFTVEEVVYNADISEYIRATGP